MARLNTKRLLRQCKQIAAKQAEQPETSNFEKEAAPMDTKDVTQRLSEFLFVAKDAQKRYSDAVETENNCNQMTQDILHVAEFAPEMLQNIDVVQLLHQLRTNRRTAKQELEVTRLFQEWAEDNRVAINKLEQTLGAMRKVLKWQPAAHYIYKTDIIGDKGSALMRAESTEPQIQEQV